VKDATVSRTVLFRTLAIFCEAEKAVVLLKGFALCSTEVRTSTPVGSRWSLLGG